MQYSPLWHLSNCSLPLLKSLTVLPVLQHRNINFSSFPPKYIPQKFESYQQTQKLCDKISFLWSSSRSLEEETSEWIRSLSSPPSNSSSSSLSNRRLGFRASGWARDRFFPLSSFAFFFQTNSYLNSRENRGDLGKISRVPSTPVSTGPGSVHSNMNPVH